MDWICQVTILSTDPIVLSSINSLCLLFSLFSHIPFTIKQFNKEEGVRGGSKEKEKARWHGLESRWEQGVIPVKKKGHSHCSPCVHSISVSGWIFLLPVWEMGQPQVQAIHEEQDQACSFTFHWRDCLNPCSTHRCLLSIIYKVTCIESFFSGNMLSTQHQHNW